MDILKELVRTISHKIPKRYSEGEISIEEFVKEFDEALNSYIKVTVDDGLYDNETESKKSLDAIEFKLSAIIKQTQLKKLENNKQDGLVLVKYLKENVNELEKFFKEDK